MPLPPFALYPSSCPECDATKNLVPCECGAVFYCGSEHKRLDSKMHKKRCCEKIVKIVKIRQQYEEAKEVLSARHHKSLHVTNVLEIDPVYLVEGADATFEKCLEERQALARALRASHTRQALEESTEHLWLNTILRPDSLYSAPRVVASYLVRANRGDECHDFLRQYTLALCRSKGWLNYEQMANEKNCDSLNDTNLLHSPFVPNEVLLFATVIKLRMLAELKEINRINDAVIESIGHRLPLELFHYVRLYLHENPILANMRNARQSNYKERISQVKAQIDRLWWEVRQRCKYMWPYLLDSRVMDAPPRVLSA